MISRETWELLWLQDGSKLEIHGEHELVTPPLGAKSRATHLIEKDSVYYVLAVQMSCLDFECLLATRSMFFEVFDMPEVLWIITIILGFRSF